MKARPHAVFRRSQYTVQFELPNDVFFDFMALYKLLNSKFTNGYKLTPDDHFCMALEDYIERYLEDTRSLLKRVTRK